MLPLNQIPLNALRAIEAVGRLGSLAAAAAELGVSVGAVSQQVIKAEAQLGRPVFRRTGRGLVATDLGRSLLPRLNAGFREIAEALEAAQSPSASVLTISVAPVFASKWLVPRLSTYARSHPDIMVRIDATTAIVDLAGSDVDLAIRVGAGDWPGVTLDFLLPQEVFPVCAPQLAERLREPADILEVPAVIDAHSVLDWELWLAVVGLSGRRMKPGYSFTDAALALDAAIAGQGVMLAWPTLASYALSAGQLVAPFPERAPTGLGYYAVTAPSRQEPKKVADFKTWLKAEIAATTLAFEAAAGAS